MTIQDLIKYENEQLKKCTRKEITVREFNTRLSQKIDQFRAEHGLLRGEVFRDMRIAKNQ